MIRSLGYQTDIDVLAGRSDVVQRDGYVVVRSPHMPTYYWGNFLLFERAPHPGDLPRWEALFAEEFAAAESQHKTFGWDDPSGEVGSAQEFVEAGYDLQSAVVLTATDVHPNARHDPDLEIRPIHTEDEWAQEIELSVATRDEGHTEEDHRQFSREKADHHRALIGRGLGHWLGAFVDGKLVGSLGIVVIDGRCRYQNVSTHPNFERRGICGTLVHHAGRFALDELGATQLVMIADEHYHAARIYESVGFRPTEKAAGVMWFPRSNDA